MDLTIGEVAALLGGTLTDDSVATVRAAAIRSLAAAGPDDLSFYKGDRRYLEAARATKAAAIIADGPLEGVARPLLVVEDAALAVSFLLAAERDVQNPPPPPGVHATASVDAAAVLGEDVTVGPCAVVEAGARIGARSRIGAGAFVGRGTVLGEECLLHPHAVVLHNCHLGARVVLWPFAVIGRDGFGFLQRDGRHLRIPQVGGVRIGDDVEVGAFSSIDRGAVDPTVVEEGVKIDSHCHVAHNCHVGEHALFIGRAAVGGSVKIGKRAILGQDAGVSEGRKVGEGAILAACTRALYSDVAAGEVLLGSPARPFTHQKRIEAIQDRLPELVAELRDLRKRVAKLDGGSSEAKKPSRKR